MKLIDLLRSRASPLARSGAQDHAEKLLAESFRMLGQVCSKLAELIDAQRLTRAGYETPGKFLQRIDAGAGKPKDDA